MGPRLTARQGVELLKIHQLRRENAAIYQQLQSLRDAVTNVKDEHEIFRDGTQKSNTEIKSIKASLSENQHLHKKIAADVEMLLQSRDEMRGYFEESQKENEHHLKRNDERHDELRKTVQDIQLELKDFEQNQQLHETGLQTAVSKMQDKLTHKAEATDLDALWDHLTDAEARLTHDLGHQTKIEAVLVQRSTEEEIVPLESVRNRADNDFIQHPYRYSLASSPDSLFDDPDKITETASYNESEVAIEPLPDTTSRLSSFSGGIDLDQNLEPSFRARSTSPSDSLITIPYSPYTEQLSSVDRSFKLKQGIAESLLTYMTRAKQMVNPSVFAPEELKIQQLVDGVLDTHLKVTLIQWLEANAWNWKGLERFVKKHISESSLQTNTSNQPQPTLERANLWPMMEDNPASTITVPVPRTPRKNRPRRQNDLYRNQRQLGPKTSSASPLLGKVLHQRKVATCHRKPELFDVSPIQSDTKDDSEVPMPNIKYTPLSPSPYNPRPRLVPRKGSLVLSVEPADKTARFIGIAKRTSSRSVPEEFPPWIMNGSHDEDGKNRSRKKKRTVPPPPAIPILSTSSEANKERFSRWYSP